MKNNETKSAPAGHYFTKGGNLVKGRLTKDARERGARKSDPKDKMRSKVPAVTQYNPDEATDGTISTSDAREAEKLAKKGIDVKLTDEMTEQDNVEYSDIEIKTIAAEVGKALNSALEQLGEEVTSMKVKGIESDPKGGSFELVVDYKDNPDGDEFSFYISGSELHLTDFTFDKVVGEVGTLPSGKPVINRDVIKNNLVKHFRSKYLEEKKGKDHDGDGDIDSDDYLAARDKAIKKAMKTEMNDEPAKDKKGNMLYIGDIIGILGLLFQAQIDPNGGKVVLTQVEDETGTPHPSNNVVKAGSEMFSRILKAGEKVASYSKLALAEKDSVGEDLDVGHQDDEPDMLKQYAYDTAVYAAKLYKQLNKYDQMEGEVDFPNWWQAKVIKAKEFISSAQHYLEFEEKQPALDRMALEGQVNERSSVLDDIIHDIRVHGEESGDVQGTAAEYIFNIANAFDINLNDIKDYLFEEEGPAELDKIYDVILKYVKDPDEAQEELDNFISQGKDGFSDELYANLSRDPEFRLALKEVVKEMIQKKS